jgi:predicted kinase
MHDVVADAAFLREQAAKCVRLARSIDDEEAAAALRNMAMMYEIIAKRIDERALNGERPLKVELPPQA